MGPIKHEIAKMHMATPQFNALQLEWQFIYIRWAIVRRA